MSSTKRKYLQGLVAEKNSWFRSLTDEEKGLGFLGWHERGYMPHCDYPGLVQLVTFRLADSMPYSRRSEWEHLLRTGDPREKRILLEGYLDRGIGQCHLRDSRVAKLVEDTLLYFHNDRYELHSWVVMPNHAHALLEIDRTPLARILQSWKSYTTSGANKLLERVGRFWEPEYWDTFMRDEEQERRAINYVENNPVKARLCRCAEEWPYSSACFRDPRTRKLNLTERRGFIFESGRASV